MAKIDLGGNRIQNVKTDETPLSISSGMLTILPPRRISREIFILTQQDNGKLFEVK